VDETECGTNRGIAKRAQPSRCSRRLLFQPRPNGLNEQYVDQARDNHGSANVRVLGFACQELRGRIEPFVHVTLILFHPDPLGEYRKERRRLWAFELERATQQPRDITAAPVTEDSVRAPFGTASDVLEWYGWCLELITELVVVSLSHEKQVAFFKSDYVARVSKAQPAGASFDEVEMRKVSRSKPYRPGRREFTPAEDPPLQPERFEDVGQNVSPASVQEQRQGGLSFLQEDRSDLKAI
jgi:hypothetical protein